MSGTLMSLLVVEIVLTGAAAALFLWRSFLDMREEDQLILDEAEAHLAREQAAIRGRVNMLSKYIRVVGTAWGVRRARAFCLHPPGVGSRYDQAARMSLSDLHCGSKQSTCATKLFQGGGWRGSPRAAALSLHRNWIQC